MNAAPRNGDTPRKARKKRPLDIGAQAIGQIKGEIDSQTEHADEIAPDDVPKTKTMKEASRQRRDTFVVESDLDDADEREAAPGTREQD